MKYIVLVLALALGSAAMSAESNTEGKHKTTKSSSKNFERPYGMAGCGLGSLVMGKQGGQVSAATTNGTLSNQMTGISAGSMNCIDAATAEVANRMDQFIIVNHSQFQGDVAKGSGETISAISSYMGCSQVSAEIGQSLKANYSEIFTNTHTVNEITDSIINVILNNPELSKKCNKLVG